MTTHKTGTREEWLKGEAHSALLLAGCAFENRCEVSFVLAGNQNGNKGKSGNLVDVHSERAL